MRKSMTWVGSWTALLLIGALVAPWSAPGKTGAFSGRAVVLSITNSCNGPQTVVIGDTGELPAAGGTLETAVYNTNLLDALSIASATAFTSGTGTCSVARVVITNLVLTFQTTNGTQHTLGVGGLVNEAFVCCFGSGVLFGPRFEWSGLTLDGNPVTLLGSVDERLEFPGGYLAFNINSNDATTNSGVSRSVAITVVVDGCLVAQIASVKADVTCSSGPVRPPNCDRVKGGGFIRLAPKKSKSLGGALKKNTKATCSLTGGREGGQDLGRLTYIDHRTALRVVSIAARAYSAIGERSRRIAYEVLINGQPGAAFVEVTDNGEPGAGRDTFSIRLSTGYTASGVLAGGNIKLSTCPPPFL